jgi:hypothetical protein
VTENNLSDVRLGDPYLWESGTGEAIIRLTSAPRGEDRAVGYKVRGVAEELSACILRRGPGIWCFSILGVAKKHFVSKEAALNGFKEWLVVNV